MSLNKKTSLKSTKFHHVIMQRHIESISVGLYLNLNISGTPQPKDLVSGFTEMKQNTITGE